MVPLTENPVPSDGSSFINEFFNVQNRFIDVCIIYPRPAAGDFIAHVLEETYDYLPYRLKQARDACGSLRGGAARRVGLTEAGIEET